MTLKLELTQTRNRDGHLLGYLFVTDADNLNLDMIHDGQAFSDRRIKHTFRSVFDQTENDARIKKRGMWKEMTDDQQPVWRREWLKNLKKDARP